MNDLNMLLSCFREKMPEQGLLDDGDESRLKEEVSFLSFSIVFGPLLTRSLYLPQRSRWKSGILFSSAGANYRRIAVFGRRRNRMWRLRRSLTAREITRLPRLLQRLSTIWSCLNCDYYFPAFSATISGHALQVGKFWNC